MWGEGHDILDDALVDPHLVRVPGLGTLTVGGLAGGDLEGLGGQADGALDAEVLVLGALEELGRDLLEGLDLARGEGDADLVDLLYTPKWSALPFLLVRVPQWGVEGHGRALVGRGGGKRNVQAPRQSPSRPSGKTS